MSDKQRIDALEWIIILIGAIAFMSFVMVIQLSNDVNDLNHQIEASQGGERDE